MEEIGRRKAAGADQHSKKKHRAKRCRKLADCCRQSWMFNKQVTSGFEVLNASGQALTGDIIGDPSSQSPAPQALGSEEAWWPGQSGAWGLKGSGFPSVGNEVSLATTFLDSSLQKKVRVNGRDTRVHRANLISVLFGTQCFPKFVSCRPNPWYEGLGSGVFGQALGLN